MFDDKRTMNRRRFLYVLALGAGVSSVTAGGMVCLRKGVKRVSETRILMGTLVNITIMSTDKALARTAVTASLDRMKELELVLSRFDPTSQVSELNLTGRIETAHPALLELIHQAQWLSDVSEGAFDITVKPLVELYHSCLSVSNALPTTRELAETLRLVDYRNIVVQGKRVCFAQEGMSITLDGIAKGYIVDAGVAVVKREGFENLLIEAGGDLVASGFKERQKPWKIGIRGPRNYGTSIIHKVSVRSRGMATSGDYEQAYSSDFAHHHIVDPRLGFSPREAASVTVTAPTAALADGLSTALMVLGPRRGRAALKAFPECEAYMVTKDMECIVL